MADIKNYMKEREQREQNQRNYKDKIKKHKLTSIYRTLLLVAVVFAVVMLIYVQYKRHVYTGYDTLDTVPRSSASGAIDLRLEDAVLTYSKDGAHCTDAKGNVTWNQTYEIQDVKLANCRDVVAIGNYNGRNIYLGNKKGLLGEINTTMPIRDLTVSANGWVTAVLADADITWVNTYNAEGENVYSGQTRMYNSGYPVDVCLSPDGELLVVSYVYVDAGVVKTNVAFYNFGPVGANKSDFLVGGYTYSDMLIPRVQFMNNDTLFAVGDSRLMFFKGDQVPVSAREDMVNEEVKSVFYNENYVGLVFRSNDSKGRYRLDVYSAKPDVVGSFFFDIEYNDIFFEEEGFVVYNETECVIQTFEGAEKYNGNFTKTVDLMLPTNSAYKYILVTEQSMDTIQLK